MPTASDVADMLNGMEAAIGGDENEGVPDGATAYTPANAYAANNNWTMPRNEKYEHTLCWFMAFIHGRQERYVKGTLFTREQLLQIQPQHVHDYLAHKAFHKINFSIDAGDRPIHARSSHLEQLKKGISYFMVDKDPHYMNGQGNPTKHSSLRKLIETVKLCEVRGEGAPSKTKRAMTLEEFQMELKMLREYGDKNADYNYRVKYCAMALWQYHLIGRIDDVCNFGMGNPKGHGTFDFAAKTKVQWSKNVRDEAKCPDQILLGAEDP